MALRVLPGLGSFQKNPAALGSTFTIEGGYDWTGYGPYEIFSIKLTPELYQAVRFWQDFVMRRLRFLESINQVKKLDGMFSKCPPLGTLLVTHRSAFRKLDMLLLRMDKEIRGINKGFVEYQLGPCSLYGQLIYDAANLLRIGLAEGMANALKSSDRYRRENALRTVDDLFPSLRPTEKSLKLMRENIVNLRRWTRLITLENKKPQEPFPNLQQDLELFQYPKTKWKFNTSWNTSLSLRWGPRKGCYDKNGVFVKGSNKNSTQGSITAIDDESFEALCC